jgi:hypothetical protein
LPYIIRATIFRREVWMKMWHKGGKERCIRETSESERLLGRARYKILLFNHEGGPKAERN